MKRYKNRYKMSRYKNLSNKVVGNYIVKKLFTEISTLGVYINEMKPFKDLKINNTDRMLRKCYEVTIRAPFFVSICKNREWPSRKLLSPRLNQLDVLITLMSA